MGRYPFIFSDERKYRLRRHLLFWITWWLFQGFLYSFVAMYSAQAFLQRLPLSLLESLIFLVVHMFLSYSLMYFLIPRYILKQKYLMSAIGVAILALAAAGLSATIALTIVEPIRLAISGESYYRPPRGSWLSIHLSLMAGLRGGLTIAGVAAAIKLMKSLYLKEQRNLQLQKENVESQLQLLKAQVHPHFLFNTLNNIYSYTQNTSPEASRLVTGLSDLLRFILYECNQPLVPLSQELKMIRDYIELEKVRYGNALDLHVDIPEDTNDLQIAPLLVLPLIENSFKHGTSRILEQPWINLQITLKGDMMRMKLMNGKSAESQIIESASGIGVRNVEKRLELLYPNKHDLVVTNDDDVFIVNLKVELEPMAGNSIHTNKTGSSHG
ncbi:histidine kinase [Terrimonas sp. NA20]|uniref:Histidine kinase n=1 Tax=Terrimonas ginsenosidimutans TaxID=2908004 RepID=A0ABS9KL53_9BACT|nr:histidine kinase [Terrimonas ginsenosidimutans]MCG2613057.1 histidine kinase [Terrimonas ginsenosidimutans]